MVKLSKKLVELLKDDIANVLYENALKPMFANEIAVAIRRDNEFTKKLLFELKELGVVEEVNLNKRKKCYLIRKKWRIKGEVLKRL